MDANGRRLVGRDVTSSLVLMSVRGLWVLVCAIYTLAFEIDDAKVAHGKNLSTGCTPQSSRDALEISCLVPEFKLCFLGNTWEGSTGNSACSRSAVAGCHSRDAFRGTKQNVSVLGVNFNFEFSKRVALAGYRVSPVANCIAYHPCCQSLPVFPLDSWVD